MTVSTTPPPPPPLDLEALGYNKWDTEVSEFGDTLKFQKRMDIIKKYREFPLCDTNGKVHININYSRLNIQGIWHVSYKFDIIQEANGIWSTLGFYGLSQETVEKFGVDELEDRLMELWKHFYFLQYQI